MLRGEREGDGDACGDGPPCRNPFRVKAVEGVERYEEKGGNWEVCRGDRRVRDNIGTERIEKEREERAFYPPEVPRPDKYEYAEQCGEDDVAEPAQKRIVSLPTLFSEELKRMKGWSCSRPRGGPFVVRSRNAAGSAPVTPLPGPGGCGRASPSPFSHRRNREYVRTRPMCCSFKRDR